MNRFRHPNYKNENSRKKKIPWYDWLINYIPKLVKNEKKKKKKKTEPRIRFKPITVNKVYGGLKRPKK